MNSSPQVAGYTKLRRLRVHACTQSRKIALEALCGED
jgi:hypothetical protein